MIRNPIHTAEQRERPPVVLCLSGLDPTGGAGLQADIEAIAALGGHAVGAVTCLTVQDTRNVQRVEPVDPDLLRRQIETLLADVKIDAIKLGLLGSAEVARLIATLLPGMGDQPLILDPVLAAGGGSDLARDALIDVIRHQLIPQTHLATPNAAELQRLSGKTDPRQAAQVLLTLGCEAVLTTRTDSTEGDLIEHHLYRAEQADRTIITPRLPGRYHGSGCTLASACALELARGRSLEQAIESANQFTLKALRNSSRLGQGQAIPRRCPS